MKTERLAERENTVLKALDQSAPKMKFYTKFMIYIMISARSVLKIFKVTRQFPAKIQSYLYRNLYKHLIKDH